MSEPLPYFEFLDHANLDSNWEQELSDLWRLKDSYAVTNILIVSARLEEHFYRSNNLAGQLMKLFENVDFNDPDEDDIEELGPLAQALFKKHFLLDEVIDPFYEALKQLPTKVQLRWVGEKGIQVNSGRPALLAIKDMWSNRWTFEKIMERLERSQSIGVEAKPILIHSPSQGEPIGHKSASELLGKKVNLVLDAEGKITQVLY